MVVFSKFKIYTMLTVCLGGLLFAMPNILSEQTLKLFPAFLQKRVNLGLDLRGGSHIQLEVDTHSVTKEYLANILGEARKNLRKKGIKYKKLHVDSKEKSFSLRFTLLNLENVVETQKIIKKIDPDLLFSISDNEVRATFPTKIIEKKNTLIVEQSMEVVRRRIDATGTKEPNIQRKGGNRIVVELPGVGDPTEIKRLIGTTARLSFQWVDENVQPVIEAKGTKAYLPPAPVGSIYLPEERPDGTTIYVAIKKPVIIQGDALVDAQATFSDHGQPCVSIKFNNIGKQQMYEASKNLKKQFAIVLDNKVISAPVFQDTIPNGNAQISGSFSVSEAKELALLLRAGSLPAPLKIVEECTIGPSLGEDSIVNGKRATIISFAMVTVFMLVLYSVWGMWADIALIINAVLLFAGLSLLGATLTLPGIAGIALTLGMAVDANVLIFERIKEELRNGMRLMLAIDQGYKRALGAILDANLTTLIGAWILYYLGTGAIKGFAVTLALGIIISMFTALTLTQFLLVTWVHYTKKTGSSL